MNPDDAIMPEDTMVIQRAIGWHLSQDTMTPDEWTAFILWLEADPEHARAYDSVARRDRVLESITIAAPASDPAAANDDHPMRRRWLRIAGGTAIAAGLAFWLTPMAIEPHTDSRVFATRAGERRDVRLADGTRIAMNGDTVLRVSGKDARSIDLDRGEASFRVVHDPARPFTIQSGGQIIQDVGTRFDVVRTQEELSVAVAEGSVILQPGGANLHLAAGDAATVGLSDGGIVRRKVTASAVGGWQTGWLSFDGAPLSDVADSLRRLHGFEIDVTGDLSHRPFTGMIHVNGAADRDVPHLADLVGATWRRDNGKWILAERAKPAR